MAGIGCAFFVMGLIGAGVGLLALLGWNDRIELEFFEIELNDRPGRIVWTIGCLIMAGVGAWVVRRFRDER